MADVKSSPLPVSSQLFREALPELFPLPTPLGWKRGKWSGGDRNEAFLPIPEAPELFPSQNSAAPAATDREASHDTTDRPTPAVVAGVAADVHPPLAPSLSARNLVVAQWGTGHKSRFVAGNSGLRRASHPSTLLERLAALRAVAAGSRDPADLRATGLPALVLAADLLTSAPERSARGAATQPAQGRASEGRVSLPTQDGPKSQEVPATAPDGEAAKKRLLERLRRKPRPKLGTSVPKATKEAT